MRIGYGYRRRDSEFDGLDCERLYIDTPRTDREERAAMFRMGIRSGDTLVMLARGDLGYGRELQRLRIRLGEMGVTVEYAESPKKDRKPPGRPAVFEPSKDDDKAIQEAWHDEWTTVKGALGIAARLGYQVEPHHLRHRYGNRFKKELDRE